MAESIRLAATPSKMPTADPLASRISMRASAAERICFACAPSATRIFSERKLFSVCHDAYDLDRHTVAVFKIASNSVLRVKEPPGELLIHNGNRWGLCSVGKAHIASRDQRCSGGGQISR